MGWTRNQLSIKKGEAIAELLPLLVTSKGSWWETAVEAIRGTPDPAPERVVAALGQLTALGDPRAIPYLMTFLAASQDTIRHAAARTVEHLLPRDPAALLLFEMTVREHSVYANESWWPKDRPGLRCYVAEQAARIAIDAGLPTPALGLLSMNGNGRTREFATRALARLTDGSELCFLLLRANDWVKQVADVARRALERRCVSEQAASFAAMLPIVERLSTQRRVDNSELVDKIEALLTTTDDGEAALVATLFSSTNRDARRAVARLIHRRPVSFSKFEAALADSDAVVRTQIVMAALERSALVDLHRHLPTLLSDRAPRIRSLAFHAASAKAPKVLEALLPELLFDDNLWIREFARQKLGRDQSDFARIYATAIAQEDTTKLKAALAGLGEVGTTDDAATLLPYMTTGISATRQVALRAVVGLLKEKAVPTLTSALGSDSAGVSKVAAELILTRGFTIFAGDIAPFVRSPAPHVRSNTLRSLARINKWEALIAALEHATDTDPRVVAAVQRILARWVDVPSEIYVMPKGEQLERLRSALAATPQGAVVRTVTSILERAK